MPRKRVKLTDKLKAEIKSNHAQLYYKDFDGEALAYLRKVKSLAKGRKTQEGKKATVEELVIPKDSELYRIIEKGAKLKKMTVKQFTKKYKKELLTLAKEGDFIVQRETEYLIDDIRHVKKGNKIMVNDGNGYRVVGKYADILHIQQFTQHIVANTDIFLITYRVHLKTAGDLSHYLPSPEEYEEMEEQEELEGMLDGFYPEITYLKSGKGKDAKPKKKIIEPYSKKRKEAKGKTKPVGRNQRKSVSKTSKNK